MSTRANERRSDSRRSYQSQVATTSPANPGYQSLATATYSANPYYTFQATTTSPASSGYQSPATATYSANPGYPCQIETSYPAGSYYQPQAATTHPPYLCYQSQPGSVSSDAQPSYYNPGEIPDVTYAGPGGSGTRVVPMAPTQYASVEAQYGYRGAYVAASARLHQNRRDGDWICVRCLLTLSHSEHV
jgi:hypothetical protein